MEWEYLVDSACVDPRKEAQCKELQERLNKYGSAGWELCANTSNSNGTYAMLIFRKPMKLDSTTVPITPAKTTAKSKTKK